MPKVIIIGAGLAGMRAAQVLLAHNYDVKIVEANQRYGGRTWTDYSLQLPFDIGAFVIHGSQGNPIAELAARTLNPLFEVKVDNVFLGNAHLSSDQIHAGMEQYQQLVEDAGHFARQQVKDMSLKMAMDSVYSQSSYPDLTPGLYGWLSTFKTLFTGAGEKLLSGKNWDKDETPLGNDNNIMLKGYQPIVDEVAQGLLIELNQRVIGIEYHSMGVTVQTENIVYEADAVIITVPLGVLKHSQIKFTPELPTQKTAAIERLEMGVLNKIALRFPEVFWPKEQHILSKLVNPGTFAPWFLNYYPYFKEPVLIYSTAGAYARELEAYDDQTIIKIALEKLEEILKKPIPFPVTSYYINRWGKNPYSYGSYSYIPVGASGEDYNEIARPALNKLFFAGEATNPHYPGTTHGAYLSGERAAKEIISLYS